MLLNLSTKLIATRSYWLNIPTNNYIKRAILILTMIYRLWSTWAWERMTLSNQSDAGFYRCVTTLGFHNLFTTLADLSAEAQCRMHSTWGTSEPATTHCYGARLWMLQWDTRDWSGRTMVFSLELYDRLAQYSWHVRLEGYCSHSSMNDTHVDRDVYWFGWRLELPMWGHLPCFNLFAFFDHEFSNHF